MEHAQARSWGRIGIGSGDALPRCIVCKSVEGAHQTPVDHSSADLGRQVRAQVRAMRFCDADGSLAVSPGDDLLAHPRLTDQLGFFDGLACFDEIPALRERRQRSVLQFRKLCGCHLPSLHISCLRVTTDRPKRPFERGRMTHAPLNQKHIYSTTLVLRLMLALLAVPSPQRPQPSSGAQGESPTEKRNLQS